MTSRSEGTPEALKSGPDTAESRFKYATAFCDNIAALASTHSVDPTSPYSSASGIQE
ncbi:MAG: hypothetical protein IPL75_00025 [Acidobacteria bacterium]|nr:hypothetical protein [Acidobacteriota bacterium]